MSTAMLRRYLAEFVGTFLLVFMGGGMNPARSLGPAFFGGPEVLSQVWIYIIGPIIGATIAALLFEVLRGGKQFSKGVPESLDPVHPKSEEEVNTEIYEQFPVSSAAISQHLKVLREAKLVL